MSTDEPGTPLAPDPSAGSGTGPLTRAELRALREAAVVPDAAAIPEPVEGTDPDPLSSIPARARPEAARDQGQPAPPTHRPRGRFALTLASVTVVLALVSGGLAVYSLTQGPRLSDVQVDPREAIELSGSRVILTANQLLAPIDLSQVAVIPQVPFTVDAVGRSVGVRFSVPLDDDTEYLVTVAGVTGVGGGPASDLTTTFMTPASEVYLLQRTSGEDTIFRTALDGQSALPVFSHPRIATFRDAGEQLVVAVEDDERSRILVVGADGALLHELELPGEGQLYDLQVSDRGGVVGYLYSDLVLSDTEGRASVLVTQPLAGGDPEIVRIGAEEVSVVEWQFVPDTSSALFIDFSGGLFVVDRAAGSDPAPLGNALSIQGIERGSYTAIILSADGESIRRNLADGTESPVFATEPDFGVPDAVTPFPGGVAQHIVLRDELGLPTGQLIVRADDDGTARSIFDIGDRDALFQVCPSPSGQYLAVSIAPDLVSNPFDDLMLAMPEHVETHLLNLRTGESIVVLAGFNISWCSFGPRL